jgi:hypothetical protein
MARLRLPRQSRSNLVQNPPRIHRGPAATQMTSGFPRGIAWLDRFERTLDPLLNRSLDVSVGLAQIKPRTALTASVLAMGLKPDALPRPALYSYRDVEPVGDGWNLPGAARSSAAPPIPVPAERHVVAEALLDARSNLAMCALILTLYQNQWEATKHAAPRSNAFGSRVGQVCEQRWLGDCWFPLDPVSGIGRSALPRQADRWRRPDLRPGSETSSTDSLPSMRGSGQDEATHAPVVRADRGSARRGSRHRSALRREIRPRRRRTVELPARHGVGASGRLACTLRAQPGHSVEIGGRYDRQGPTSSGEKCAIGNRSFHAGTSSRSDDRSTWR